jgi:hypothetical protein
MNTVLLRKPLRTIISQIGPPNYQNYILIIDEISKVCGSIGLGIAAHNSLCLEHINQFGSEEQKLKYLPKLCSGVSHVGAFTVPAIWPIRTNIIDTARSPSSECILSVFIFPPSFIR